METPHAHCFFMHRHATCTDFVNGDEDLTSHLPLTYNIHARSNITSNKNSAATGTHMNEGSKDGIQQLPLTTPFRIFLILSLCCEDDDPLPYTIYRTPYSIA